MKWSIHLTSERTMLNDSLSWFPKTRVTLLLKDSGQMIPSPYFWRTHVNYFITLLLKDPCQIIPLSYLRKPMLNDSLTLILKDPSQMIPTRYSKNACQWFHGLTSVGPNLNYLPTWKTNVPYLTHWLLYFLLEFLNDSFLLLYTHTYAQWTM